MTTLNPDQMLNLYFYRSLTEDDCLEDGLPWFDEDTNAAELYSWLASDDCSYNPNGDHFGCNDAILRKEGQGYQVVAVEFKAGNFDGLLVVDFFGWNVFTANSEEEILAKYGVA